MARFNKIQVISAMKETGMVPVFFNSDIDVCKNVIKACYEGGVRVFEFTNRGDFAHEIFGELVKWAAKECPELISVQALSSMLQRPLSTFSLVPTS